MMLSDLGLLEAAKRIWLMGYEGIELPAGPIAELTVEDAERLGDELRLYNLDVVGVHMLLMGLQEAQITSCDSRLRDNAVVHVEKLARNTAALGGKIMVWGSPGNRTYDESESWETAANRAVEVWKRCAEFAETHGVVIALEPLGPSETNFMNTAEEAIELIERVGSPNVRLLLDMKAMGSEAKPMDQIIRESADYLVHFHANDPNRRGPGQGKADTGAAAKALNERNYDGWVSVEAFECPEGGEVEAKLSLDCLKSAFSGQ